MPKQSRQAEVAKLLDRYGSRPVVREAVLLELLRLVRDNLKWKAVVEYIDTLPPSLAQHPLVLEQKWLAVSEAGDVAGAAGQLEAMIDRVGPTTERLGLLGGRYKRLYRKAGDVGEKRFFLSKAIDAYQRGMDLDLNAYYPISNLPRLYRERNDPGDAQLATEAETVTAAGCRAAIARDPTDRWARSTLLGVAFERGDVPEAIRLRAEVEREGAAQWELKTTLDDLPASVARQTDDQVRAGLQAVLEHLRELL